MASSDELFSSGTKSSESLRALFLLGFFLGEFSSESEKMDLRHVALEIAFTALLNFRLEFRLLIQNKLFSIPTKLFFESCDMSVCHPQTLAV